jgi:lipopolysaccharide/colanic/teichoic acid biosynthesis glycosyltransferase
VSPVEQDASGEGLHLGEDVEGMKRLVDIVGALVLGLLALPFIAGMALILAVELRAWPLFSQERVGRDGKLFRFVKLRTLPRSVPAYADKYALDTVSVHRFSAFLRRQHLDELPQLYLVLIGKMSLVGPRPEMPYLHNDLDPRFASERTSVRPGCTGLWQIGARCLALIGEAPEYDRFYVRYATLRLDAWIATRTVRNLFPGRHLLHLDEIPGWTLARRPVMEHELQEAVETVDA